MRKRAYNFTLEEAYAFMGLQPGASPEEVKNKYRLLAPRYHSDLGYPNDEMMKKLNRAKDVIDAHELGTGDVSRYRYTPSSSPLEKDEDRERVEEYLRREGLKNVYRPGKEIGYWGEVGQEDGLGYFIQVESDVARLVRRRVTVWPRGVVASEVFETHRMEFVTPEIIQAWIMHMKKYNKIFDREDIY